MNPSREEKTNPMCRRHQATAPILLNLPSTLGISKRSRG